MKNIFKLIYFIFLLLFLSSCVKEFLDKKPDKALVVPKTLKDFQALLDHTKVNNSTNTLNHIADGDFNVDDNGLESLQQIIGNTYLWKEDIAEGNPVFDWNTSYEKIFYANIVLDGMGKLDRSSTNAEEFDQVKGSAFFVRAHGLFELVQQFAEVYDAKEAESMLGMPIRTKSDVNIKSKRASLKETYMQILEDLDSAVPLLQKKLFIKFHPSQVANYALLARVHLQMGNYVEAYKNADAALAIQDDLLDYNDLNPNQTFSFPDGHKIHNKEVIYYTAMGSLSFYRYNQIKVSSHLINLYEENDLRKRIFYNNTGVFKGSYGGNGIRIFTGLSTAELYLIRSECQARMGNLKEAMKDLNTLMEKRWKRSASFLPFSASDETEALTKILIERRKELVTRGLRWYDLKRLNKDPRFQVTLDRSYNGKNYKLQPNDKRYIFPIGSDEIDLNDIQQNNR